MSLAKRQVKKRQKSFLRDLKLTISQPPNTFFKRSQEPKAFPRISTMLFQQLVSFAPCLRPVKRIWSAANGAWALGALVHNVVTSSSPSDCGALEEGFGGRLELVCDLSRLGAARPIGHHSWPPWKHEYLLMHSFLDVD